MRNSVVLCMVFLLFSCSGEKQTHIPGNVLPEEKMADVMTDIHLLEASMNLNISNAVTSGNASDLEMTLLELLKKKGVTKEQYQTSFLFYVENPSLLSEVYQMVLNNLSQLQAKAANEKDTTVTKEKEKDTTSTKIKLPKKP